MRLIYICSMQDPDTINQENIIEDRHRSEERRLKNLILSWSDEQKKQAAWSKHFTAPTRADDSYLLGFIF